jgi:hypothetical protein
MIRLTCMLLCIHVSSAAASDWPKVESVPAQPLLAQVKRLKQALEQLGQPVPNEISKGINSLDIADAVVTASSIQEMLDSFCIAAVEIDSKGVSRVIPQEKKVSLVEQGWRTYLVKVINQSGVMGPLRVDSPNARPVPNGPKAEVESRWMAIIPNTAQPMLPNLSGLKLEYTLVQIYSRDSGDRSAEINFRIEGGSDSKLGHAIREWNFEKDTAGWQAEKNCKLVVTQKSLQVAITAEDPYFSTKVDAEKGKFVLRFWAKFDKPGIGQVFWTTKERSQADGNHLVNFPIEAGVAKEYDIRFNSQNEDITGIRIDPGNEPGLATFDWITLSHTPDSNTTQAGAKVSFVALPSVPVTFQVTEFDGKPTMAAFLIRDSEGRVYPAQAKRLAPDFFFHPQVYRGSGETVRLPAGKYTIKCSRGPESIPEIKELIVGSQPIEFRYSVNRWIDPTKQGWYSGDHHIHAAGCQHYDKPTEGVEPIDMMRHILGEDLKIGCCLTWGPCFDYQKRFFTGKPDDVSKPPYILRYDVEVSGFGSHASGHLNLLNLQQQIYPGGDSKNHWPTLGMNTLRWAKKQGAITGPAHSGNGLTRFVGRIEGAKDGSFGIPHFNIPAYDGIGANEFIVDVTHHVPGPDGKPIPAVDFISTMDTARDAEWTMWYHVLNCGFRVRASGETDFPCISGERVGMGRVYAKVDGDISFEKWIHSVHQGRSYVSDGATHLMNFEAIIGNTSYEVGLKGSEIQIEQPGSAKFKLQAAAWYPERKSVPVELIINGVAVEKRELPCDGKIRELSFSAKIDSSCWVAVRIVPTGHTNPFFVSVGGKPIRGSKQSVEWCLAGVEQCWKMKAKTYKADERKEAEDDYNHARKVYSSILKELE